VFGVRTSTATMELISSLSIWTVLIAIAGGAAGAEAQVQSDRDSLVTGTATGFLVAVALSPPAAVLGLAATIERWDYVAQMAFTLLLTYAGIVIGGSSILRLNGIRPSAGLPRVSARVRNATFLVAAVALVGLVSFQRLQAPSFRKADLSFQAVFLAQQAVESLSDVQLLESSAHFTRGNVLSGSSEALLLSVWVAAPFQEGEGTAALVRAEIEGAIRAVMPNVVPYVEVVVLPSAPRQ
jgi:uncharacterized membrane protein